ncbi:hypothetical protein NDU88_007746 [Pleurodeles waltl]|uniref:Uncharacterized protein n=1 Tax=Pleurodeles waltl TaxID=8319 RepID=A0AAV7LVF5_PLEWA|nr:hypothetical protein NDU88_007746 [Pleurodeles waltl]
MPGSGTSVKVTGVPRRRQRQLHGTIVGPRLGLKLPSRLQGCREGERDSFMAQSLDHAWVWNFRQGHRGAEKERETASWHNRWTMPGSGTSFKIRGVPRRRERQLHGTIVGPRLGLELPSRSKGCREGERDSFIAQSLDHTWVLNFRQGVPRRRERQFRGTIIGPRLGLELPSRSQACREGEIDSFIAQSLDHAWVLIYVKVTGVPRKRGRWLHSTIIGPHLGLELPSRSQACQEEERDSFMAQSLDHAWVWNFLQGHRGAEKERQLHDTIVGPRRHLELPSRSQGCREGERDSFMAQSLDHAWVWNFLQDHRCAEKKRETASWHNRWTTPGSGTSVKVKGVPRRRDRQVHCTIIGPRLGLELPSRSQGCREGEIDSFIAQSLDHAWVLNFRQGHRGAEKERETASWYNHWTTPGSGTSVKVTGVPRRRDRQLHCTIVGPRLGLELTSRSQGCREREGGGFTAQSLDHIWVWNFLQGHRRAKKKRETASWHNHWITPGSGTSFKVTGVLRRRDSFMTQSLDHAGIWNFRQGHRGAEKERETVSLHYHWTMPVSGTSVKVTGVPRRRERQLHGTIFGPCLCLELPSRSQVCQEEERDSFMAQSLDHIWVWNFLQGHRCAKKKRETASWHNHWITPVSGTSVKVTGVPRRRERQLHGTIFGPRLGLELPSRSQG